MNDMMPELGWMLQGAGSVVALLIIAMVGVWLYQAANEKPEPVGEALNTLNLVDQVLSLNIIDAADPAVDLAREHPDIFVRSDYVAGCMHNFTIPVAENINAMSTVEGYVVEVGLPPDEHLPITNRNEVVESKGYVKAFNEDYNRALITACTRFLKQEKKNGR